MRSAIGAITAGGRGADVSRASYGKVTQNRKNAQAPCPRISSRGVQDPPLTWEKAFLPSSAAFPMAHQAQAQASSRWPSLSKWLPLSRPPHSPISQLAPLLHESSPCASSKRATKIFVPQSLDAHAQGWDAPPRIHPAERKKKKQTGRCRRTTRSSSGFGLKMFSCVQRAWTREVKSLTGGCRARGRLSGVQRRSNVGDACHARH